MTNEEVLVEAMERMGQRFAGEMANTIAGKPPAIVAAYGLAVVGAAVAVMAASKVELPNIRAAINSLIDDIEAGE